MTKEKWKTLLNLIVTIITAIAATLTTQSCMRCSAAAPAAPRERMNACRMRGARLPSAPMRQHTTTRVNTRQHATTHVNTRQHERAPDASTAIGALSLYARHEHCLTGGSPDLLHCYIVTLLH